MKNTAARIASILKDKDLSKILKEKPLEPKKQIEYFFFTYLVLLIILSFLDGIFYYKLPLAVILMGLSKLFFIMILKAQLIDRLYEYDFNEFFLAFYGVIAFLFLQTPMPYKIQIMDGELILLLMLSLKYTLVVFVTYLMLGFSRPVATFLLILFLPISTLIYGFFQGVQFSEDSLLLYTGIGIGSIGLAIISWNLSYFVEKIIFNETHATEKLKDHTLKINHVLFTELSEGILKRLKEIKGELSEWFINTTVMSVDLDGLILLSDSTMPEYPADYVSEVLTEFQTLANQYKVRIDDVNKVYIALDMPEDYRSNYAHEMVQLAMKMMLKHREISEKYKDVLARPLNLRIGINSGPIVLCYFGQNEKIIYDFKFYTTSLANYLRTFLSETGGIFIGETTYNIIKDQYPLRKVGSIVMPKGEMQVYKLNV